ncbi:hypothetical protein GLYMA_18G194050v4 [Glycine max]|nr:hypothetical protein GLYMA_18G194050v4 [Glycine max]KAH1155190.1 hypothetical protein GYH30_050492 [Glycine max]
MTAFFLFDMVWFLPLVELQFEVLNYGCCDFVVQTLTLWPKSRSHTIF